MRFEIKRVGHDGEGIAYYEDKPVFIYNAYLDEVVEADLILNKRGSYEGILKEVITPSIHRIEVKDETYVKCGGTNLMHISYDESLRYKRNTINFLLSTKLRKETKNTVLNKTVPSDNIFNYRNKTDLPVRRIDDKNVAGMYVRGTNKFMPISNFIIEDENLGNALKLVLEQMDLHHVYAINPETNKGLVYSLSLRTNEIGEIQLVFITNKNVKLDKLAKAINKINPKINSIYQNYVKDYKDNRDIYKGSMFLLFGDKYLNMKINNNTFLVTPFSFFQLNTKQAIKLYDLVVTLAEFNKEDVVLDAYSGVGTIASHIAPHVKKVIAVEEIKDAVRDMQESLKINNITNVIPKQGDITKMNNAIKEEFDIMVFDPPRIGLGFYLRKYILTKLPKKIIYVSCDPRTLTDDLKELSISYDIKSITPLDMFPQTSHIESITVLTLKK